MARRTVDVDLESFHLIPAECQECLFWELPGSAEDVADARFQKEEWFSSTLLEWGDCGKVVLDDPGTIAFAQFAPATLFPRLAGFACGSVSGDAAYLAYCYVANGHRSRGVGSELVGAVARDLLERGYRAVEAIGDRAWDGSWVLPVPFLAANGFAVIRDDPRYPLLRLSLIGGPQLVSVSDAAAVPLPSGGPEV